MTGLTDIEQIYNELEKDNVIVATVKMNSRAMTVNDDGVCIIGIDERQFDSAAELKTVLLHEQAHFETDSFYNIDTPVNIRRKLEYRADKHVSETKITKNGIESAHKEHGITELWEFAEYFNVTLEYMKRILYIHYKMEFIN